MWLLGRQRRVVADAAPYPASPLGREQVRARAQDGAAQLLERRQVVEDPERSAVRSRDEGVVVDRKVAHRRGRQAELQRLPVIPLVEGDGDTQLGPGVQQS